ncbi:MAG TPA: ClpXP protease specificity-enhancing factor SspB [Xanthobacteraceae bacterium]|jgi:hypothetical protein
MADLIRYDLLAQDALRGVVRKVLTDVAREGLKGDHHFYVAFDTRAPGVRISDRLHAKYPEEMTIVLQHQFWDLTVTEQTFEVGVSFGGTPERLLVPFTAIKGFFDPSVQFGLQFEVTKDTSAPAQDVAAKEPAAKKLAHDKSSRPAPRGAASEPEETRPVRGSVPATRKKAALAKVDKQGEPAPKPKAGAEIVSLDKFRKK